MSLEIKRQNVLKLYQELVEIINYDDNDTKIKPLTKVILKQIKDRIEKIREICEVKEYDLYFNGVVGVGKTTIISKIFNLIDYSAQNLKSALLLETGSGKTTICEVQIIPNKKQSKIYLEPVEASEFYITLKEFCEIIENDLKKDTSKKNKDINEQISAEVKKFIKNMILKGKKYLETLEDMGLNENSTFDDIFKTVKNVINYENRKKTVFNFESGNFKDWLKNTFREINAGKNDNAPLPKRIVIEFNNTDLDIEVPYYVKSIIDTKGIDIGIRKDIEQNMSLKDSISFMCEKIANYGSEDCLQILRQKLREEEKDIKNRVVLLGLERGAELKRVGGVDTYEEGKQQKIEEAKDSMYYSNIVFNEDNFWFINSIKGIKIDPEEDNILTIDENIIKEERSIFFNNIEILIEKMYEKYNEEMNRYVRISETLLNFVEKEEVEVKNIENTINEVKKYLRKVLKFVGEDSNLLKNLGSKIDESHASKLRAMVNRSGDYENFNYYFIISKILRNEFEEFYDNKRANINGYLEKIFEDVEQYEKDNNLNLHKIILDFINEEINESFLYCIEALEDETFEKTKELLYNDNIWRKLKDYWGNELNREGRGYKTAVKEDLMIKTDLDDIKNLKRIYIEKLKDKILNDLELEKAK